jgi:hypothetical protein
VKTISDRTAWAIASPIVVLLVVGAVILIGSDRDLGQEVDAVFERLLVERDEASLDPVFEEAVAEATELLGDRVDTRSDFEWHDFFEITCRHASWVLDDMTVGVQAVEKVHGIGVSAGLEMARFNGHRTLKGHLVGSRDKPGLMMPGHLEAEAKDRVVVDYLADSSKAQSQPAVSGVFWIKVCAY